MARLFTKGFKSLIQFSGAFFVCIGFFGCSMLDTLKNKSNAVPMASTTLLSFKCHSIRTFERKVYPLLTKKCLSCHSGSGQGGLIISNTDMDLAYSETRKRLALGKAETLSNSILLMNPVGSTTHTQVILPESNEYQILVSWANEERACENHLTVLNAIRIVPESARLQVGQSLNLRVMGDYADGEHLITSGVNWAVNPGSVASISKEGLLKGVSPGFLNVSAVVGDKSTQITVIVLPPEVVSIEIVPEAATIAVTRSAVFKVTAQLSDQTSKELTPSPTGELGVTWSISDTTVATVDANGVVKGLKTGSVVLSALHAEKTATASITIIPPPVLNLISISPSPVIVGLSVVQQLTVLANFSDESVENVTSLSVFSSEDPTLASVSTQGLVTGKKAGSTKITVSYAEKTATEVVTVLTDIPDSVEIFPPVFTIATGVPFRSQLVAVYPNGSKKRIDLGVEWSTLSLSSPPASPPPISTKGVLTATTAGPMKIVGSYLGKSASSLISVTECPTQEIFNSRIKPILTARCKTCHGTNGGYDSSFLESIARIDISSPEQSLLLQKSSGAIPHNGGAVLETSSNGYLEIRSWIDAEGKCSRVPPPVLENLSLDPASAVVNVGFTKSFSLQGTFSDDVKRSVISNIKWSSSNPELATILSSGLVTGQGPGTATIKGTVENIDATAIVEVKGVEVVSIDLQPVSASIRIGQSLPLKATATMSDSTKIDITNQAIWTTADGTVVSITSGGVVSGLKVGVGIRITAKKGSASASTLITVYQPTLNSVVISPLNPTIRVGDTQGFTLMANYSDSSATNVTTLATTTWTATASASPALAVMDSMVPGKVRALGTGTVKVKGAFGGRFAEATLKILPATLESLSVSPLLVFAKKDMNVSFTAVAHYSDSSSQEVTTASNNSWTSSNVSISTVTPQGRALSVAPGVANIQANFNGKTASGKFTVVACTMTSGFSVAYKTKAEPIFQAKCFRCHGGPERTSEQKFLLKGPPPLADAALKDNFLSVMSRIDINHPNESKIITKSRGESHTGGIVLTVGSEDYNSLLSWVYEEQACKSDAPTSNASSNLVRSSSEILYIRLRALLPNEPNPARPILTSNSFNNMTAQGLDRTISDPLRFSGSATQIALRAKVAPMCQKEATVVDVSTHALFSKTGILMTGETLPPDNVSQLALAAARNTWLYPYLLGSGPVQALIKSYNDTYTQAVASGKTSVEATLEARQALCMSAVLAPAFLLGNPYADDVIRRLSLEVGRQLPRFSDYKAYRDQTSELGRSSVLKSIFSEFKARPEYLAGVKSWFQEQLGLRPLRVDSPFYTRTHGPGGASELAGWYFRYNDSPIVTIGDGSREIQMTEAAFPIFRSTKWDSALCENRLQEFDPNTSQIVWQHYNSVTSNWETIGKWKTSPTGDWVTEGGFVTLSNLERKATTLADITMPTIEKNSSPPRYVYATGSLMGTPVDRFLSNDRRVIRYGSDGLPQTGHSKVRLWYSNESVYVCNNTARYLASCNYRPTVAKYRPIRNGKEWSALKTQVGAIEYEAPILEMSDSILHPSVLSNFRCGTPNRNEIFKLGSPDYNEDLAYPRGDLGSTGPSAAPITLYIDRKGSGAEVGAPERMAIERIYTQMAEEPYKLIEYLVSGDRDFRELVTANYTFVGRELHQFYQTQGYFMPVLPTGFSPGTSTASYKLYQNDLVHLPLALFRGSYRDSSGIYSYGHPNVMRRFESGGAVPPRQFSGILTQNAFLEPVSPKMRSFSARIFTRLMCGLPNTIQLTPEQIVTQLSKMPENLKSSEHTSNTQCKSCHQNLDPLGVALSGSFSKLVGLAPAEWIGEFQDFRTVRTQFLFGVRNGGLAASEGAFLGERVTGIEEVAHRLSQSREFARCMVLMTFQNIFGREPGLEDQVLIDRVTDRFQSQYIFNKMIEDLVSSYSFRGGN